MAASDVSGYLMMLNASMLNKEAGQTMKRLRHRVTHRFLAGTALRGYLGLRGNLKVRGRRKVTDVRILRRRVPKGPLAA